MRNVMRQQMVKAIIVQNILVKNVKSSKIVDINTVKKHKCEECGELKDSGDQYCEEHKCKECGELKNSRDDYCEEHTCPRCGNEKDEYDNVCSNCEYD